MFGFEFKSKLKRLNPLLYVDDSKATPISEEWSVSALYCSKAKRSDASTTNEYAQLNSQARSYLEAYDQGHIPDFICGVPKGWVPEHDIIDSESGKLLAQGWRVILKVLINKGYTTAERAKKVFGCQSLGEATFDKLTYEQKVARIQANNKRKPLSAF